MTDDVVKKMLELEKRAKDIVSEAEERKKHIDDEVENEIVAMRESYAVRADSRVEKVMQFEETAAEEKLAALRQATDATMAKIKKTYDANKEKWICELYKKVIG